MLGFTTFSPAYALDWETKIRRQLLDLFGGNLTGH
jgi:hypothetical protein